MNDDEDRKDTCQNCRWMQPMHADRSYGDCRRRAPATFPRGRSDSPADVSHESYWPTVWARQWCGDFERRKG